MTVIRPNSVSGINSITAQANEIKIFKSDGTQGGLIIGGANLNATSGISTVTALNVTGNVSVGGTLTYQDVTNIDSVGIITARAGVHVTGGNVAVGHNNPSVNLHVKGSASNGQIYLGGTGAHSQIYADNDGVLILNADQGNSAANSYLGFNVDNSERLRITSGGLVGVNVTPTQQKLTIDVDSSGTTQASFDGINIVNTNSTTNNGSAIVFGQTIAGNSNARIGVINSDRSGGSEDQDIFFGTLGGGSYAERVRITSTGRLLVGTTSSVDSSNENLAIVSGGNTQLTLARDDTSVGDGHTLAQIKVYGNDSNGTYQECARIGFEADGAHATDDKPTRMVFETTADGASSPTERLRITAAGNAEFAGTVSDSIGNIRQLGQVAATSSFTIASDHAGKFIRQTTSGRVMTVPADVFSVGTMITIVNRSSGTQTIAQGSSVTMRNSADGATGDRTLAADGMCTLLFTASNEVYISGAGLS